MVGTSLSHYKILRKLGAGGMGEVYLAEDTRLKRQVALKVLPAPLAGDAARRERFQREAEAVAALDHPNIVTIHSIETATAEGAPEPIHFLTMQLVPGRTLAELIPDGGLDLDAFLELATPLADALGAVHGRGIAHRDLKPANIMVGEDRRLRVLDFGLARVDPPAPSDESSTVAAEALTREGTVLGTAPYMSPEHVRGLKTDARSDVFSLGTILYEMLTGARPFAGPTGADVMSSILRDTPRPIHDQRPGVPEALIRIIERCLEKDRDRRYPTAAGLHADLAALRAPSGVSGARPEAALELPDRPSLAILPFVNLSGDPEQDYFAAGLWADLNAELVKVSGLFLVSQTTTSLYQGKQPTSQQVGRELGVRHILQGTVRRAGNRVRVTAELVDVETGQPCWGERYDRTVEDLFELQDEITEEIVTGLDVKLVRGEGHRIVRRSLKDPRARDIYYQALESLFTLRREALVEARAHLVEVSAIEPDSPLAFVFQAFAHYFEGALEDAEDPEASMDSALQCAERAIELDDPSGTSHLIKGLIHLHRADHDVAVAESERSLRDRPNCPWAYALRAAIFNYTGNVPEALELARLAIRHTPLSPPLFPAVLATSYYLGAQLDEAIDAARRTLALAPDNLDAHIVLAAALAARGNTREAATVCQEILRLKGDFSLAWFAERQPYRDRAVLDGLLADLRAAGLS